MAKSRISVAGLMVDALSKQELLQELDQRLAQGKKTFMTTLYSEFLYAGLKQRRVMEMLNTADIAIPDGIAILWGQRFLSLPLKQKSYYGRIIEAYIQMVWTGAQIILSPKSVRQVFPEKIVGADFIWDIAKLASEKNYSIYLLGGFGDTPKRTAEILTERFPDLRIVGASNKHLDDLSSIPDINAVKPDILLVAYSAMRQENWIVKHKNELSAKLFVGLGGTFDYVVGYRKAPPRIIRSMGLEWLYRLFTQPHRIIRIKNATWDLVMALIHYKVFMSLPLRRNVVMAVLNDKKEILIARRNMERRSKEKYGDNPSKFAEYWQLPQGGPNELEDFMQAAVREAGEELGTNKFTPLALSAQSYSYEWNNAMRPFFSKTYRYRGQDQRVVYLKFEGNNTEIKVDNIEFIDYKWVQPDNLIKALHPERRPLGEIVLQDLKNGKCRFD